MGFSFGRNKMNRFQEEKLVQVILYARKGWHVVPCGYNKIPAVKDWVDAATTDEEQILQWWGDNPNYNVSIATGNKSGFFVVDVDMKDGKNGLKSLCDYFGDDFDIDADNDLWAKTPSGGMHFCFKTNGLDIKTCSDVLDGVDIRGEGGQIVAAPSSIRITNEWKQYRWKNSDAAIPDPYPWVNELVELSFKRGKAGGRVNLDAVMKGLSQGSRDDELNRYAWHLASRKVPYELALPFVLTAAEKCKPPMDKETVTYQLLRAYEGFNDANKDSLLEQIINTRKGA